VQPFVNTFRTKILFLTGIVKNERKIIIRQKGQQPAANGIDGLITFISGNLRLLHRLSRHSQAIPLFDSNIYRTRLSASNCRPARLCYQRKTRHCSRKCIPFVPTRVSRRVPTKKKRTRALSNAFVDTTSRHRHRYCNRCNCAKKKNTSLRYKRSVRETWIYFARLSGT